VNDIAERGGSKEGDAAITSTVKTEHIKNLEDELKTLSDKAEHVSN
jgi:hypothetical protein